MHRLSCSRDLTLGAARRARWLLSLAALAALISACSDAGSVPSGPSITPPPLEGGASAADAPPAIDASALLPDLQILEPRELYIEPGVAPERRVLRFSSGILNAGPGPLELVGTPEPNNVTLRATQLIYRQDGAPEEREVGRLLFDGDHEHWHFDDFTLVEVWTHSDGGDLDELVETRGKGTFCAVDEVAWTEQAPPPAYLSCGSGVQGISAGWTDTYAAVLPGQDIDISDLDDGPYAIKWTVDPDNRLVESDETNNTRVEYVRITGNEIAVVDR